MRRARNYRFTNRCSTNNHSLASYLDIIYCRASKRKPSGLDILCTRIAKIVLDVLTTERSMSVYKDMKRLPMHFRRLPYFFVADQFAMTEILAV